MRVIFIIFMFSIYSVCLSVVFFVLDFVDGS